MKHEQYTKKLRRILTTLNTESFKAIPRALYVFGSYSRGAPEPGDLDLLFVYDLPADHEKEAEFWSLFCDAKTFKREFVMQYVREFNAKLLRRGEQNHIMYDEGGRLLESIRAGGWMMDEEDLVLLWSDEDRDWEPKLDAIKVNPKAGRAPRNHFCELNRLVCGNGTMFVVMEMLRQKVLKMKKIPVDLKNDSPPMLHEPEHQRWLRFNERSQARPRVKHAQILRYGLWWLEREHQTVMENAWFEKMLLSKSQTHLLLLGKPARSSPRSRTWRRRGA